MVILEVMEMDIPLARALLLWNPGWKDSTPAFAVRPLGHQDYDRFSFKVGACFRDWQQETDPDKLKLRLMIEAWHAEAFYAVPVSMIAEALLVIPEYRDMLADDCLPKQFQHERE